MRKPLHTLVLVGAAAALAGTATLSASAAPPLPAPPGLDHFKCYTIKASAVTPHTPTVLLIDQFGSSQDNVAKAPNRLCNPVEKRRLSGEVTPVNNPMAHLVCYRITEAATPPREVRVQNQFGTARLTVGQAQRLCLPSWKMHTPEFPAPTAPGGLDHFKCYAAKYSAVQVDRFENKPPTVVLKDQFETAQAKIGAPVELCNPVEKRRPDGEVTPITNFDAHQVCFVITQDPAHVSQHVFTKNQFGNAIIDTVAESRLCLPSFKQLV